VTTIDLNADLGEGCEFDVELMGIVSSCNIACGGHAGDTRSMAATVDLAVANDVAIGAHPSYPDRSGFGRASHFQSGEELRTSLINQIDTLQKIVVTAGNSLRHVKPHGALYNDAAADRSLAKIVVQAVQHVCDNAALIGPPKSELESVAAEENVSFIAEAFVDRAYLSDGLLVPRSEPNAVHSDMNTITTQAVTLATKHMLTAENGDVLTVRADTLCIHGDTANAAEIGLAVRDVLLASGVSIRAAI
jgi:UPF0271 protein